MRLFLTGGTGFIGSYLLQAALKAGHEVRAFRRESSQARITLSREPEWVTGTSFDDVPAKALAGCDVLIHCAAYGVSPQPCEWETAMQANVAEPMSLMLKAVEQNVSRLVVCGSCTEFGSAASRYDSIPADAPMEPIGAYASSKAAFTTAFSGLVREKELHGLVARVFHVFGEGQDARNFWPSLKRAALAGEDFDMSSGEQVRDFTSVEVVAKMILEAALNCPLEPGQPQYVNLSGGQPQRLAQFAEHWWEQWQATGTLRVGALPQRANEVMRYVPQV